MWALPIVVILIVIALIYILKSIKKEAIISITSSIFKIKFYLNSFLISVIQSPILFGVRLG